jgi:hypothetical protein
LGNYSSYGEVGDEDNEKADNIIVVQRDDFPEHVLRIRIDSQRGALFTNIESITTHGLIKAKSAEAAICPDITTLQEQMAKNGIATEWTFRREPGEVKMKEYIGTKAKIDKSRKTEKNKQGKITRQIALERRINND